MPSNARAMLQDYYHDMRAPDMMPVDALDQFQLEMAAHWLNHLEIVMREEFKDMTEEHLRSILAQFMFGIMPRAHDGVERQRLEKIARDALMHAAPLPRFHMGDMPRSVPPHVHRNDHTHPSA